MESVGFTGTQFWGKVSQLRIHELAAKMAELWEPSAEFHHGVCIGMDAMAHTIARRLNYRIIGHPPVNSVKRAQLTCDEMRSPRPYLDRDHDIVNEVGVLLATPIDPFMEQLRSGTWATIRYARKQRRQVFII